MRFRSGIVILVLGLAVPTVGCGAPPTAHIDAAKTAITSAVAAGAGGRELSAHGWYLN